MDSVDSHKKRACPHYPQPYDDGDDAPLLWVGALGTLPEEDHNKHSLKWYNFLGELPPPAEHKVWFSGAWESLCFSFKRNIDAYATRRLIEDSM